MLIFGKQLFFLQFVMGPRRKPSANLACLRVLQTEPASNRAWICPFWNPYTQTSSFGVRYPNNQFGEFFLRPRHPKKRVDRSPFSDLTKSHQRLMMFEWQDIQIQYIPESSNVGVSQHEPPLCILWFTSDGGSWIVRCQRSATLDLAGQDFQVWSRIGESLEAAGNLVY